MPKAKVRLWHHEKELLDRGLLTSVTHANASSIWLRGDSTENTTENHVLCYRHMGDIELKFLLDNGVLPSTQPYQTLTRGQEGRLYCEKYLRSNKYVDTSPTTIVEFLCNGAMIEKFFAKQSKIEDGTISHGLGSMAGDTLLDFNESLQNGETIWQIVLVKRPSSARC